MSSIRKVVVIGLDGLDPRILGRLLDSGELPNLAEVKRRGGFSPVRTTFPPQTPVAWSTFATGTNPGGHGIFDFVRRDPKTYLPDLALNRYEQKSAFLPPKAVNLRRGTAVWELLSAAGISATVLRAPCTFPPDSLRGRMLAGMGVPDIRGGLGTSTFYTSSESVEAQESENVVRVRADRDGTISTRLIGPRNLKTGGDFTVDVRIHLEPSSKTAILTSDGQPRTLHLQEGRWSDWLKVRFKTGLLQSVAGMVRFHLLRMAPVFELYASPVNFDPDAPLFPISSPATYARELASEVGTFYTTGMVEDHGGLNNGRFDEGTYLDQCEGVMRERERMMLYELERLDGGLFFCLFDTPDRLQHMFWRFRERTHPANRDDFKPEMGRVIEEHYRACDGVVGKALECCDGQTLFIVLSDHGFSSFQRGFHLNTWLHDRGYLALNAGVQPGEEAGDLLRRVDWGRTKAYALGLGSIYLNLEGREAQGVVRPDESAAVKTAIVRGLTGLVDPERGKTAVGSVVTREQVYTGAYAAEAPDLIVNFTEGYRVSWSTVLGGIPRGHLEDNVKKWGGDHIIEPVRVPGVLFMNRPFRGEQAGLTDLAPTILAALGVPKGAAMEGASLLE